MKRILIVSRLPYRRMNGVARYLMGITAYPDPATFGIDLRVCEWGREQNALRWHNRFFPHKVQPIKRHHHWHNRYLLPWAIKRSSADLIHLTFNGLPSQWHVANVPYVLTLHGSAPFHAHKWGVESQRGDYTRQRLDKGRSKIRHIITCSEWSKQELQNNYALPAEKITVQPYGIDLKKFRVLPQPKQLYAQLQNQFDLQAPFLLHVGASAPRKNVVGIVNAFAAFKQRHHTPHKLLLAGPRGSQFQAVQATISRHQLENDVLFTNTISDETLIRLYNGATALIFPSFYEGFGYPIIEAMACGTPVITANITAMPEVGGTAAHYVDDPYQVPQITAAIERVVLDEQYQTQLRQKGLQHVQAFSWQTMAENQLRLYQQLL